MFEMHKHTINTLLRKIRDLYALPFVVSLLKKHDHTLRYRGQTASKGLVA